VSLSIFALAIIGSAGANEFPIKKLSSFTWLVDYKSFWSPDGTKIMCARRLGDMNVVIFAAPK
jgi:hypothetical protein